MTASDIAWRPHGYYRTRSNVARFMRRHDVDAYDDLVPETDDEIARFWDRVVEDVGIVWDEPYETVLDTSDGPAFADWFVGGKLNATRTILDQWAAATPDRPMYHWENERGERETVTCAEMEREVNVLANALRRRGIGEGDVVGLVCPLYPTAMAASLACLKVGAIQTQVFAGYGTNAIEERLADCGAELLVIADGYQRSGETIDLRSKVDASLDGTDVETVVVDAHLGLSGELANAEEVSMAAFTEGCGTDAETAVLDSDHPSFIAYSSGTTGTPKGTIHTHASLLAMGMKEAKYQFDVHEEDVFTWVTDFGWVVVPIWLLAGAPGLGAETLLVGGAPTDPDPERMFDLIERYGVTTLGISPTGARGLRQANETPRESFDLGTIRVLGSTGEPWDRETWTWFQGELGGGYAPVINVSGGTELCGSILGPTPLTPLKPGTLGGPAIGVPANVYDEQGEESDEGYLVIEGPVPGMTNSLTAGEERYLAEYWADFEGVWNHNDWVEVDDDGYWYVTGRADDTMNVSGRRVTAPEIEEVLLEHPGVEEAAVVAVPDETRGERPVAFVTLADAAETVTTESLNDLVTERLGGPFRLSASHVVRAIPRTQTGKIPRGRLEMTYLGEAVDDVSTLENGDVLREYPRHER